MVTACTACFKIVKVFTLSADCTRNSVFCVAVTINSDLFREQHYPGAPCNGHDMFRMMHAIYFMYYLPQIILQNVNLYFID